MLPSAALSVFLGVAQFLPLNMSHAHTITEDFHDSYISIWGFGLDSILAGLVGLVLPGEDPNDQVGSFVYRAFQVSNIFGDDNSERQFELTYIDDAAVNGRSETVTAILSDPVGSYATPRFEEIVEG